MRKNKQDTTQYSLQWDDGSYHTGPAQPPKRSNGLVVVLLVAVIFLGGMASAMGIINFHLISVMNQQQDPVTPLVAAAEQNHTPVPFFQTSEDPAPSIPDARDIDILQNQNSAFKSAQEIYSHNEQSLVSVYCTTGANENLSGTGVVLSSDGYILTNAHIVEAAARIFVCLPDGQQLRAAKVGSDPLTDLAVLYVQAEDLTPAIFADAQALQANDTVYALSHQPDAQCNVIQSGTVCGLQTLQTGDLTVQVLQSSLTGTTGPVFDGHGQIVAIQAGKIHPYFPETDCSDSGMSIPSAMVQIVVADLIAHGQIDGRPALGIQVEAISKLYQQYWDLPGGLRVTIPDETCNAALQGLQDGDILLTLDGVQLQSRADLYTTLYQSEIGEELIAAVFRDGRTFTLTLTVEEIDG